MIFSIILISTLFQLTKSLDTYEQEFLCLYDGIDGFPVNCSNVINACNYQGISCDSNLSLITFNLPLCGGTNILPTNINNLVKLTGFQVTIKQNCLTPPEGTIPVLTKTNLQYLGLANLYISGTIPSELFLNTQLISLDISNTKLSGTIPYLNLLTSITQLNMENNNLSGLFPNISNLKNLEILKISNNNFTGSLPNVTNCNRLGIYDVSVNNFTGDVGTFNSSNLYSIDISGNKLDGTISRDVLINTYDQIAISMKLNKLIGTIPSSLFTKSVIVMDLSSNYLSGTIPKEIINMSFYSQQIILARNLLSGTLPKELNNVGFSDLFKFDLSYNNLQGNIPSFSMMTRSSPSIASPIFSFYKSIIYIQFYSNNFTGIIPYFSNFNAPVSIDFSNNMLDIDINSFGSGGNITWLNLANNAITNISNFGQFDSLISLNLGYNLITGTIPSLFNVQYLRLNNNYFTGKVDDLLINPNFTIKPIFVDLTLNRLDIDVGRNTIFGTQSTQNSFNTEIIINNFPQDIDECSLNISKCSQLCTNGYFPVGFYTCDCISGYVLDPTDKISCNPCVLTEWNPINYSENNLLFPQFRRLGYNISSFKFSSCSKCNNGISVSTRSVLSDPSCSSVQSSQITICSFACSDLSAFTSSIESIYTLKTQFETDNFLNDIIYTLFNINITIKIGNKRSQAILNFIPSDCNNNFTEINKIIAALTKDIVPNIPGLLFTTTNCSIDLITDDSFSTSNIILIVILGAFGIILLLIIIISVTCLYFYKTSLIHYLPKEVSWSFLDKLRYPWKWNHVKNDETEYYYRDYDFGSKEFDKVEILLTKLKKGPLKPIGIRAIYNPNLTSNFINQWKIMIDRKKNSPDLFFTKTYTKDKNKMDVMKHYDENVVTLLDCNQDLEIPLIPAVHGTSLEVANNIGLCGFGVLNSLDPGFFGSKSLYFSGSVCYCLPYAASKRSPAIIISYLNMGNVFPVTEDHLGPSSLMNFPLKAGFHSHYVLTNKDGHIYNGKGEINNELVVSQESQVLPSYIISLEPESCLLEFEKWKRVIPEHSRKDDIVINFGSCDI